jgi:hypothetical protein
MMRIDRLSMPRCPRALIPTTALLLTMGLSACDLPGSDADAAAAPDAQASAAGSEGDATARLAVWAASRAQVSADPSAEKEEALPVPKPDPNSVELTPMENAGRPDGNARLSVRFDNAEELGDALFFEVEGKEHLLKRDEKDRMRFSGMVHFDFDRFAEELQARKKRIEQTKTESFDVFVGRELIGKQRVEFIEPEVLAEARDRSLALNIRPAQIFIPPPPGIDLDPARTLMITDVSVVEDPERTYDTCTGLGNPDGAWTFKTLMTHMANQSATGVDPAVFVEDWLQSWNVNHTINTFPVPARTRINTRVLNNWPRIDGKLDLNQSPMRLLAIANRTDLRKSSLRTRSIYGGGGGIPLDAGEGRFVFGVMDRDSAGGCRAMEFTVILEYGVPIRQCKAIRNYAQQWSNLNQFSLGDSAYNAALQAITDQFTAAGADPNKPNGSAINQIRTNEIALSSGYLGDIGIEPAPEISARAAVPITRGVWELREFHLLSNNLLNIVSTANTPHHSHNNTQLLADYINSGITNVPLTYQGVPFLTGSTLNFSVADGAVWNGPGADNQRRHEMSLGTCNACHGGEARDNAGFAGTGNGPETNFVHITTRNAGAESVLSKFLIGDGTLSAPGSFIKPDPINGWPDRSFGDLRRRQVDLAALQATSCAATGLLQEAMFAELRFDH